MTRNSRIRTAMMASYLIVNSSAASPGIATHPIPPRELRIGVGPVGDPEVFLDSGLQTLELFRHQAGLLPYHPVLDVGSRRGRIAWSLAMLSCRA